MFDLALLCSVGIPPQCHRRVGTVQFHPNFQKATLMALTDSRINNESHGNAHGSLMAML